VFPAAFGGTLDLAVPACRDCQAAISKAEMAAAKTTEMAVHRAQTRGAKRRHPERTTSGAVHVEVALAENADGALRQMTLQVGAEPRPVPAVEIDFVTGQMNWSVQEGYGLLRKTIIEHSRSLDAIPVVMLHPDLLKEQPALPPRVYLKGPGKLAMLVRSEAEAKKVRRYLRKNMRRIRSHRLERWNVIARATPGGVPGFVQMRYEEDCIWRVATKIGLGTLLAVRPAAVSWDGFEAARAYVRGENEDFDGVSVVVRFALTGRSPWPADHIALVQPENGAAMALVVMYSSACVINLGPAPEEWTQRVVASCPHALGRPRLLGPDEENATLAAAVDAIERAVATRVTDDPQNNVPSDQDVEAPGTA
jgi:hypothetical protein